MPPSMATSFLMSATHGNFELHSVWDTKETICQSQIPPTSPTYDKYFDYLTFHAKQTEAFIIDNNTTRKANSTKSDYLQSYISSDPFYEDATDLTSYMVNQDIVMIHDILQCNQPLKQGRPCSPL